MPRFVSGFLPLPTVGDFFFLVGNAGVFDQGSPTFFATYGTHHTRLGFIRAKW